MTDVAQFAGRLEQGGDLVVAGTASVDRSTGRTVVFRGYIANARDLRARLDPKRPPDVSDATLIGLAADRWGDDLSSHVIGEYAAAIYWTDPRKILLVHDTLGIGALFFQATSRAIRFATCLEDLVGHLERLDLDEDYVADHLAGIQVSSGRTPYRDVCRLSFDESVSWTNGRLSRRLGRPFAARGSPRKTSRGALEEELRALIAEGVRAAIPRSGPVWCELSGGLDSTTVLAFAAAEAPGRLTACSTIYPRTHAADEQAWIRHALALYDVPWRPLDGDSRLPFSKAATDFVAEPNDRLLTGGILDLYDTALRAGGASVVLTGQGGDAVFMGDGAGPVFLADLLRTGRVAALARSAANLVQQGSETRSTQYWLTRYAVAPVLRDWRGQVLDDHFHRAAAPSWLRADYVVRHDLDRRRRRRQSPRGSTLAATAALERLSAVVTGFTRHNNHPGAAADFRHPLLYRPLVEFMLSLPGDQAFSPRNDRALQRRALVGILPDATLARRDKAGRGQIFYDGLAQSPEWRRRLTAEPMIVERGYVDGDRWREAIRAASVGHSSGIGSLLAAISLEAWLWQFDIQAGGRLTSRPTLLRGLETCCEAGWSELRYVTRGGNHKMSTETLQAKAQSADANHPGGEAEGRYVAPEIVVIGSAVELTQGGSYNDYDSPGVRKT